MREWVDGWMGRCMHVFMEKRNDLCMGGWFVGWMAA